MATKTAVAIQTGELLFQFDSEQQWVNKGRSWYATSGVATCDTVAIDRAGRICTRGKHFMRAEKEGTYPISVYAIDDDPMPR